MKTCTVNGSNQHDQLPRENIYSLPRFRVSLVRENRATAPSLFITTSVTAAGLPSPHRLRRLNAKLKQQRVTGGA